MSYNEWAVDANCIDADPEMFFIRQSPRTARTDRIRLATALSICETCPVKQQCEKLAEDNWLEGVFGGKVFKMRM